MSIIEGISDPVIAKKNYDSEGNPIIVEMQPETHTIKNGRITLIQVPSESYRVQINGMTELYKYDKTPLDSTNFRVDYVNGIIMFDSSLEGQEITINRYYGDGYWLISASRIYTKTGDCGEVLQTLGDVIEEGKDAIDAYGGIVNAINDADTKKTELDGKITEADTSKNNLDNSISDANAINDTLSNPTNGTIKNATDVNSTLNTTITSADTSKDELEQAILDGDIIVRNRDLDESIEGVIPLDADLLNGQPPSYYATKDSIDNLAGVGRTTETVKGNKDDIESHKAEMVTEEGGAHGLEIEQGTWTPLLVGTTVAGVNNYSTQNGIYYKVGKLVIARFKITLTSKDVDMSGDVKIDGLPFALYSDDFGATFSRFRGISFGSGYTQLNGYGALSSIFLQRSGSGLNNSAITVALIADNIVLNGSITYYTD